ncbi:MAG: single-stranded-DNA-specific exonuclease RecJ [Christensenellaceae bacterium]|nr:single-stranded-DNA-specific exonuclease RecJ [Christensenellaceae bacterium]
MLKFEPRGEIDEGIVESLKGAGHGETLARLLCLRGVKSQAEAETFLHPSIAGLHSPFLMKDMKAAVERIQKAIAQGESAVIYGDYDADGVTATALLFDYLCAIGLKAAYYIPKRHGEGYGLNIAAIEELAKQNTLLITVDCGITALSEIKAAKALGLEPIVTDHHSPLSELPGCLTINPRLDGYPCPHLSGAGVALKLVQALGGIEAAESYLDIAALGTVADIVSLRDENRAIVTLGLQKIRENPRPGIKALMDNAGVPPGAIAASHVGFMIGPRINAGGRIGHSAKSVEMLLAKDYADAKPIADQLEEHNQLRQAQEASIMEEALKQLGGADFLSERALYAVGENWNPGVVGIVASRLTERFFRPSFVFAKEGETLTCSARSIRGVSLFALLNRCPELFERFGGHEMAAGLTMKHENFSEFHRQMEAFLQEIDEEKWIPTQSYDLEAAIADFDAETVRGLSRLEPFGQGNPGPIFLLKNARVRGSGTMGQNGAHLRLTLEQNGSLLEAAAFKMGPRLAEAAETIDAAATPEINLWQGRESVRLQIRQFAPSPSGFLSGETARDDELFASALPYILAPKQLGFKRHLDAKNDDIARLLGQSLYGSLLLYPSAGALQGAMAFLNEAGLLFRLRVGAAQRGAGDLPENLLCAFDRIEKEALSNYPNIVLLGGMLDKAIVDEILRLAPSAVVFAFKSPCEKKALAQRLQSSLPGIDETRAFYRALLRLNGRLSAARDLKALQGLAPECAALPLPKLYLALRMLKDMELIEIGDRPFFIALPGGKPGKKEFEKTETSLRVRELIEI